jgi:hypothetical protein
VVTKYSFSHSDVECERDLLKGIFSQLTAAFDVLKKQRLESRAADNNNNNVLESPVVALPSQSQESSAPQFVERQREARPYDDLFPSLYIKQDTNDDVMEVDTHEDSLGMGEETHSDDHL